MHERPVLEQDPGRDLQTREAHVPRGAGFLTGLELLSLEQSMKNSCPWDGLMMGKFMENSLL